MPDEEMTTLKDRANSVLDQIQGLLDDPELDVFGLEDEALLTDDEISDVPLDEFGKPIGKELASEEEDPIEVMFTLLKDDLTTLRDNLTTITGKIETVVGMVNETNGKVAVLSGQVASHSAKISELAGQVSALSAKVNSMQRNELHRDLSSGYYKPE